MVHICSQLNGYHISVVLTDPAAVKLFNEMYLENGRVPKKTADELFKCVGP